MNKRNPIIELGVGIAKGYLVGQIIGAIILIIFIIAMVTHNINMSHYLFLFIGYGIGAVIIVGLPTFIITSMMNIGEDLWWILTLISTILLTIVTG